MPVEYSAPTRTHIPNKVDCFSPRVHRLACRPCFLKPVLCCAFTCKRERTIVVHLVFGEFMLVPKMYR